MEVIYASEMVRDLLVIHFFAIMLHKRTDTIVFENTA